MKYSNGIKIKLGDKVKLIMPAGNEIAKIVMLGSNYKHLELESNFKVWVLENRILKKDSIVVEWIGENPLEHNHPKYSPVGNYMTTAISDDIELLARA